MCISSYCNRASISSHASCTWSLSRWCSLSLCITCVESVIVHLSSALVQQSLLMTSSSSHSLFSNLQCVLLSSCNVKFYSSYYDDDDNFILLSFTLFCFHALQFMCMVKGSRSSCRSQLALSTIKSWLLVRVLSSSISLSLRACQLKCTFRCVMGGYRVPIG